MITADSNVFFYISDDGEPAKQQTALAITAALASRRASIALQVVGELQHALRRKLKRPAWRAAQAGYNLLQTYGSFAYTRRAVERALEFSSTGQLSYWDGLLLASADEAGCIAMLSEDMHDGARVGGVEVVNPFRKADGALSERVRALLDI